MDVREQLQRALGVDYASERELDGGGIPGAMRARVAVLRNLHAS